MKLLLLKIPNIHKNKLMNKEMIKIKLKINILIKDI